jgi:hypothetical protein
MKKSLSQERFTSTSDDLYKVFDGEYEEPINLLKLKPGEDFNAALEKCEIIEDNQFDKEMSE